MSTHDREHENKWEWLCYCVIHLTSGGTSMLERQASRSAPFSHRTARRWERRRNKYIEFRLFKHLHKRLPLFVESSPSSRLTSASFVIAFCSHLLECALYFCHIEVIHKCWCTDFLHCRVPNATWGFFHATIYFIYTNILMRGHQRVLPHFRLFNNSFRCSLCSFYSTHFLLGEQLNFLETIAYWTNNARWKWPIVHVWQVPVAVKRASCNFASTHVYHVSVIYDIVFCFIIRLWHRSRTVAIAMFANALNCDSLKPMSFSIDLFELNMVAFS